MLRRTSAATRCAATMSAHRLTSASARACGYVEEVLDAADVINTPV
ncbi:hypothetical protein KKP04_00410 [Rhodomicrobium sp. Az07]|nr:hypothetical protein [Rhodomicrobium sp. Az07]MBT3069332.1 hypothetical protein [Rhodomicrobium sp. Az07]